MHPSVHPDSGSAESFPAAGSGAESCRIVSAAVATPRVPLGAVLRAPGFAWLFGASMLGRIPMFATGLVLVLRTRELTGSFASAGLVAGISAAAVCVSSPVLGRLVDRRGQVLVLSGCVALSSAGLLLLAVLPDGTSLALPVLCALMTG